MSIVICTHCGKAYDSMSVTVTHRHADCSVWQSPCCNRQVDDRMFKSLPDIRKPKGNIAWHTHDRSVMVEVTEYGYEYHEFVEQKVKA